ncbi:hypothetical protein HOLleu_42131 [Holothuria leucospilota]|uniref:NACHT domain-containing protein n=1 Tax=Holothuria leucospilota TaxID=206669 RepID=A0A9Q0YD54_HOLLE|nr:hypothetical protein HOLleu_42131 [Holothuria leucospilota]
MGGFFSSKKEVKRKNTVGEEDTDNTVDKEDTEKIKEYTHDEESTGAIGNTKYEERGTDNAELEAIQELFITQLKAKYKLLYDAVQPIPYIRDRLFCVDRVFVEGGIEYFDESWLPLDSYHSVFSFQGVKTTRRILIGDPGYGKSTLTLQYAYDWCNRTKTSPLRDVKILVVLRLRQLGGVPSIYRAIKQFILPRNSQVSENDIKSILEKCSSVTVILDGFDEYPDAEKSTVTDVMKIIQGEMFEQFEVFLTTRYLPEQYKRETKRLRLIGFDDQARDKYIRKAVVGDNVVAAEKIKRRLQENPVLGDLCQVPLFFVMFAHMSHEDEEFQTFKTVTNFFQYMIKCFHSHMRNKMDDPNVQRYHMYEKDHRKLDKVAFEGLSKRNQQIVWNKQYLVHMLGKEFYDQYIRIGVLVEEEDIDNVAEYHHSSSEQHQREVRFYHKVFCEWYAAHYLVEYVARMPKKLWEVLRHMDPLDLQYCYRFACGLNQNAARKIIEYLKRTKGGDKFAVLCILEQGGLVEDILDTVKSLCSRGIEFKKEDNKLLQRSTIQLLEIASSHKISISCVWLNNCYSTVDLRGGNYLQLKSNLSIPVLTTLNKLAIYEPGRGITSEEFTVILQYSSKCLALKELEFHYCLLPPVQADSLSVLRSRNVKVRSGIGDWIQWCLNLNSGQWENDVEGEPGMMTDEYYQTMMEQFGGNFPLTDDDWLNASGDSEDSTDDD